MEERGTFLFLALAHKGMQSFALTSMCTNAGEAFELGSDQLQPRSLVGTSCLERSAHRPHTHMPRHLKYDRRPGGIDGEHPSTSTLPGSCRHELDPLQVALR